MQTKAHSSFTIIDLMDGIKWQGDSPSAPSNPEASWGYYNTTDHKSYVYDGQEWCVISKDGTSVTVVSIQYQAGTSPTTPPTGTWLDTVVEVNAGEYLWSKTTFSDGNVVYNVSKQGQDGNDGASVTDVQIEYYVHNSDTSAPSENVTWGGFPNNWDGQGFIWERTVTTITGATSIETKTSAPRLSDAIAVATMAAQKAGKSLADWCVEKDVTIIHGSGIATGSITAKQLSVDYLSAITANLGEVTAGSIQSKDYVASKLSIWGNETYAPATEGLVFSYLPDPSRYCVYGYTGTSTEVYIPAIYKNALVTALNSSVFKDHNSITSIIIPGSVVYIDQETFKNCSSLANVIIGNGVTYIGNSAFYGCSSLTSIEIPDSVTSIRDCAFYNCSSLTSIEIPNSVRTIGDLAFYGCSSLTSIIIPSSVTSIGTGAFGDCDSLEIVYYRGTENDWNKITIDDVYINRIERYYYSEQFPRNVDIKNYWHYSGNGFKLSPDADKNMIDSTYFKVTQDGKITAVNGEFTGKITATSGKIGGFNIKSTNFQIGNVTSITGTGYSQGTYFGNNGLNFSNTIKILNGVDIDYNGVLLKKYGLQMIHPKNSTYYPETAIYIKSDIDNKEIILGMQNQDDDISSIPTLWIKGSGANIIEITDAYKSSLDIYLNQDGNSGIFGRVSALEEKFKQLENIIKTQQSD